MTDRVSLGPLEVAPLTRAQAADWVLERARTRTAAVVVTSNIHHLRLAELDPAFRRVVAHAELNVADGWPLVAAARVLGRPVPERVAGVDLVHDLLESGAALRVAFVGGAPGGAERLSELYASRHTVCLVDPLPKGSWESSVGAHGLQERLRHAEPELTLLGLGAPQQELLADGLRPYVAGPILCCGASIEILAGIRRRAPRWLQAAGLEWAFRLALEPGRLGPRYAVAAPTYVRVLVRELMQRRAEGDRG